MSLGKKQRWALLLVALGLTLLAAAWVGREKAEVVEPVQAERPAAARQASVPADQGAGVRGIGLKMSSLLRTPRDQAASDLFAARSWYVPPPPPKPLPPPPPSAPPLPFSFMGKMMDEGKLTVYLSAQERNYVVRTGDTIDGTYKVEEVGARMLTLTYLPLNIKQTLMIGGE